MGFILGVDEAGRGPLAGPVAVGVVAVPEGFDVTREFPGVADSKKLSEKKREKIFAMLETRTSAGNVIFTIEFGKAADIDKRGIAVVLREAVARGIQTIGLSDSFIFLDGALKAPAEYKQETIIKGDETVPLISLASIVAKVSRDRLMRELAKQYPHYGFDQHKGYGTKAHFAALREHGPCAIHRQSFLHL